MPHAHPTPETLHAHLEALITATRALDALADTPLMAITRATGSRIEAYRGEDGTIPTTIDRASAAPTTLGDSSAHQKIEQAQAIRTMPAQLHAAEDAVVQALSALLRSIAEGPTVRDTNASPFLVLSEGELQVGWTLQPGSPRRAKGIPLGYTASLLMLLLAAAHLYAEPSDPVWVISHSQGSYRDNRFSIRAETPEKAVLMGALLTLNGNTLITEMERVSVYAPSTFNRTRLLCDPDTPSASLFGEPDTPPPA